MLKNYSWKTTAASVIAILTALGSLVLTPLLDSDPATTPNWNTFFAVVAASLQGFFSRDDDKTSEQVGAKK